MLRTSWKQANQRSPRIRTSCGGMRLVRAFRPSSFTGWCGDGLLRAWPPNAFHVMLNAVKNLSLSLQRIPILFIPLKRSALLILDRLIVSEVLVRLLID
jgi:hypothetical protein